MVSAGLKKLTPAERTRAGAGGSSCLPAQGRGWGQRGRGRWDMAMEKAERTVPLLPMKYSNTATQIAMANIAAVRTVMKAVQVLRKLRTHKVKATTM